MGTAWIAVFGVLFFILNVSVVSTAEESPCKPGFESDLLIFKVNRKHLKAGTRLGKVGFTDCTDRTRFLFSIDDSRFVLTSDGVLTVKRAVVLHEGHLDFFVHSWDSQGNKMTVPVKVLRHGHHQRQQHPHVSRDAEQHHGGHRHQNHDNTEVDSASIKETAGHPDMAVLYFPKSSKGLRRRKRDWVIPPINYPENSNGPFPFKMVQVRSSEDKKKTITYSITGPGADEDPVGLFTMDKNTGDLYVHQRLDREKQANYTLMAHASTEDPMEIIIKVIDQNDNKPIFEQTSYVGEVAESSPRGTTVIQVLATDADEPGNDNSIIKYTILSQEPKLPNDHMFTINTNNGAIMVEDAGLDRETYPEYTLEIQAADLRGEGFTGKTKVVLKVTDSNDNAPVFAESTYQGSVDENAVGVQVVKLSVNDKDKENTPAWNAKFKIISGDPEKLFSIETGSNKQEGIIKTAQGLDFEKSRTHTLSVIVENDVPFAIQMTTSTATVVVTVKDVNEPPVFKEKEMLVNFPENLALDSVIKKCEAEDPDFARENTVKYKIIDDPEGWLKVDEDTGLVKVKTLMDRESIRVTDNKYTALIGAYDNDPVPATGTGTLIIKLEDVNDNAPVIEERKATVCRKAERPVLLTVVDKDEAAHSSPYSVAVHEMSKANWTAQMNETKTGIKLFLKNSDIPVGTYKVVLRVADRENLAQDSSINVNVCDCLENGGCIEARIAGGETMSPFIWGILGAVLLLLVIAILGLYAYKKWQKKDEKIGEPFEKDIIRDNIYHYAEEGGGEDDQNFDLSVLHYGLDNKPDVLRSDMMPSTMSRPTYRTLPANPDEIGNFIDDNLKAADEDPTAPPYDSLLVFDYEGGGSDAGSLSSLNSSNSGDQDYNCLNEWGPRFKKLADMYGGGEDDDDML
ncbi:cadherin-1 [Oryzias melastigma]|uniref:Cadherin-1 n=1 Tax=Oryzias melastigma TaxID=30732 RepID=A0A3B3BF59_ORYME|nr:cadherin-1 [Oryzias melastigma]